MRNVSGIGVALGLMILSGPVFAEGHSVGARVGMLGLGIEYSYAVSEKLAIRAALNSATYSFDDTESGIDYAFDLKFDSLSVGLDVHPGSRPFRVSFGLLNNDNRLLAEGTSAGNVTVGDSTYTPAEIGTLRGRIGFDSVAPFAGFGWDWSRGKKVGLSLDFGVLRQGSPEVSLSADGLIANQPDFLADKAIEEAELRGSLDDFDLYPYASIGFAFRF